MFPRCAFCHCRPVHSAHQLTGVRACVRACCEIASLGEGTLHHLRNRFQPNLSDREAAEFMLDRIQESYNNYRTNLYDAFQKRQNGIPY